MFTEEEIAVFLEELEEKLQVINDNVLLLEREGGSPEVIQEIFRAAHTIKGSSAVMGYEKMSTLTHEIENLFDRLRQREMEVSETLVDVLFEALDTLKLLKDEITGSAGDVDVSAVIEKLRACQPACGAGGSGGAPAGGGTVPAPAGMSDSREPVDLPTQARDTGSGRLLPAGQTAGLSTTGTSNGYQTYRLTMELEDAVEEVVREAEVRGFQAYQVDIGTDQGCQMKGVRAFLIFETLQQIGEIIKSVPPAEDLQEGKYEQGFTVVLLTKEDAGQVHDLVFSIAEVSSVEVRPIKLRVWEQTPAPDAAARQQVKKEAAPPGKDNIKTVRVDVQKLDTLMNLVGELVIDRTRLDRFVEVFESRYGSDDLVENIVEISNHLGQVTNDLQEEIMKARMLPVAHVFNRLPRMVRDLAHKMGKEIDFIIEGRETELDRNVIEVIGDPLIHLLRNAVDHGIEPPEERVRLGKPRTGRLLLKAAYVESHIVITLSDDGRGMDPDKMRQKAIEKGLMTPEQAARASDREILDLIFTPGFSTAGTVSDVSGRGVGMDIVRNQIEQINGSVEFTTAPGRGTTFTIKLPLTLAIIRALMVTLGDHVYAFPLTNVLETLTLKPGEIRRVRHAEVIVVRGHVLPLVRLAHLFQEESKEEGKLSVVILGSGDKKVGVVVDRLIGEQEIVIKSLGGYLGQVPGLSGATILGDGKVALIVDARGIVKDAGVEEIIYEVNRAG
ncbi:chemotaxis protein CheA [Desulfofundulus thermosubterraneus]|uniref:Chemotaxis protein CheA n=1 Tax=Desulfofundulus thermosubterraneus DSM 16057 TaxID=1121432 RepID=A0A1M6K131_9FIRM|nr:chemotaxis protein CheA [Desulfofundulus thermosubterraneus]SHJ52649.1 two-component system, chemotaxis family, sensor kinase CheA [Desulfofundulus thermosubterraneus DSM 16057]